MNTITLLSRAPKRVAAALALALGMAATPLVAMSTHAADPGDTPMSSISVDRSEAVFEGRTLDLDESWGDARACWVDERGSATCYRTEREMDDAILASGRQLDATSPRSAAVRTDPTKANGLRRASCSSSMRLYSNNWYVGYTLYLTQRYTWINMSWYGFDNVISSYRIGACSSTFRSGSNGSGSTYWGGTSAWNSRSSMPGWNNVLSSVRIS